MRFTEEIQFIKNLWKVWGFRSWWGGGAGWSLGRNMIPNRRVLTLMWRHCLGYTLVWCHFDVICPWGYGLVRQWYSESQLCAWLQFTKHLIHVTANRLVNMSYNRDDSGQKVDGTYFLIQLGLKIMYLIIFKNIWTATRQNKQIGMCAQRSVRSDWTSAKADQSLHKRFKGSSRSKLDLYGQQRTWSDWAHAQTDLSLRWALMPLCCCLFCDLYWSWVYCSISLSFLNRYQFKIVIYP